MIKFIIEGQKVREYVFEALDNALHNAPEIYRGYIEGHKINDIWHDMLDCDAGVARAFVESAAQLPLRRAIHQAIGEWIDAQTA